MRTRLFVGSAFLFGLAQAACSSNASESDPFGPEPDYAKIQSQLEHPTGTFAPGAEQALFHGVASQQAAQGSSFGLSGAASSGGSSNGGSSGGLSTQSLHALDNGHANFCPGIAQSLQNGQD